ncbi:MAG: HTH-like domain-containing protein [Terriglobales bacterium]
MVEQIKKAINGAKKGQKTRMFHYQVLKNAADLEGLNAKAFCHELAMLPSYATEFKKMIALAQLMRESGDRIISNGDTTKTPRPRP